MAKRIYAYFISGTIGLVSSLNITAQQTTVKQAEQALNSVIKKSEQPAPLLKSIDVGIDLYGLGAKVLGGDALSTEVSVVANLKDRFFPAVEVGYGRMDTWDSENKTHFKGGSPYFRIGMNYNFMYKKPTDAGGWFLGIRFGASPLRYDITTPNSTDNVYDSFWNGYVDYDYAGQKAFIAWGELLGGVRVKLTKHIYMGWTVRIKKPLIKSLSQWGNPWYVPGFGTYDTSKTGITYTISYYLPIGKR